MKSIANSWLTLSTNNVLRVFFTIVLVAFWTACADDSQNLIGPDADAASKGSIKSTSTLGDYNYNLSVSSDGKVWTYTISKAKSTAKTLSHFIINLQNCGENSASFSDIDYATVNGLPASFVNTEGSGTACNPQLVTQNFVKFGNFSAASSWVIVIYFERGYGVVDSNIWVKAGTSCNTTVATGIAPGCPISDYCALSQGYFFSKGSENNGSDLLWNIQPGVTVGGQTYTHEEGRIFWDANKRGQSSIIRAFFQISALKLSGALPSDPSILADMATIDAWYALQPRIEVTFGGTCSFPDGCFNIGVASPEAAAAAGRIGAFIANNHCADLESDPDFSND